MGKKIIILVSPNIRDNFYEKLHDIDKNNSDYFQINAKSELVEYIGHEQIVTFNYSEQQLLGKFSSTIDIDMDKDLKLYIDLNQFSLFDKNTKERL